MLLNCGADNYEILIDANLTIAEASVNIICKDVCGNETVIEKTCRTLLYAWTRKIRTQEAGYKEVNVSKPSGYATQSGVSPYTVTLYRTKPVANLETGKYTTSGGINATIDREATGAPYTGYFKIGGGGMVVSRLGSARIYCRNYSTPAIGKMLNGKLKKSKRFGKMMVQYMVQVILITLDLGTMG